MSPSSQYGVLDPIIEAQRKAEAHLDACFEALLQEDLSPEHPDRDESVVSPAVAPFCGCTTCIVREVFYASWDNILEAARGHQS